MGFTNEERAKILEGIPLEIQERAKRGDQEAIGQVKTAISNWRNSATPDFSIFDDPVIPQSIVERSNAIELAKQGNFNWDQISGMIDSGRLTDDVINFFQEEGYSTTQSASGGRIYNIGKRSNLKYKEHRQAKGVVDRAVGSVKDFVTIPWRGLGEDDPTSMEADDFYRHILKQPKGDWARTGVEKLIIHKLEERQASEQEAYEKYGDAAFIQAAGKIQSMVNAKTITAPNPRDWFPISFQKSEDGKFSANRDELLHYKNVIKEHDPFVAHQASLLEHGQLSDFYYKIKEQDQEMLDRLEKLHREGRTHLHDPEVFDWFVRRGMEKQQDLTLGQAVDAGQHLLGDVWKGLVGSKDGKGLVQEFWEGAVHGKQEAQELDDIMGATWRSLGSDYQLLSENAGGYFLDLIEKAGDGDSPEAQELYRKAKNERQRQFQLRALSNQAVYAAGAHDLANKWWQNPQQAQRNLILGTFFADPWNAVPIGGLGKKGVEAGIRTNVKATFGSALKTAKNAADEAAEAVSDAQAALGREIIMGDPTKVVNAGKVLDDAVKASDDATAKLADVARSAENMYEELMQAGSQKLSGHAIKMMGQTAEWIMDKADELLDAAVMKFAPDLGDSARRWLETGVRSSVAAGIGGVGAGFAGAVGGMLLGTPMARAIARDMQKIGSNIALGARLQPLHRALQATIDAGGNVISPVSKGARAGLKAYELAFPVLDPIGRVTSRVVGGVASVQTLEAMVMQSAIGFLGSGGTWQGAVTGGTVGFGLAGSFGVAGALTPFASQAQVNKLSATNARNYREMLKGTPTGEAFSKLSFEHQKSIAWAMGGFPDTGLKIISDPAKAAGWYNPNTNEIGINTARQDWMRHFARHVAKHEHSHYIARHVGVREKILSTLLGDVNNRKGGLFAKVDAQGKAKFKLDPATRRKIMQGNTAGKTTLQISQELGLSQEAVSSLGSQLTRADLRRGDVFVETNDNFKELTRHYMGLLTPESARDINAKGERYVQEYIAEEIFAEQGAAQLTKYTPSYAKSFRKPLWAKNLEKALNSSRLSGRAPSVLGRLGGLFGSNKKIQSSILGEFSAIPEFKEIFEGYNQSKSINEKLELTEAPGDGVTYAEILDPKDWDPSGADPSTESLKAWLANGMLRVNPRTGIPDGIEVQPDGSWRVRDPRLIRRSVKEAEDAAKEFGKAVEDWLKSNTPVAKTSQEIKDLLDTQLPPGSAEQKTVLDTIQDAVDTGVKDAVQKEIRSQRARSNQATKDYIDQIEQIIDASMVDDDMVAPRITLDGKTIIAGRYLPDELLDFLEQSGRFNPHQLENLRALNDYLRHGLHATPISVMYQSTMRAGKAKAIAAAEKNVFVTGFEVTKQGNLIYRVWNLDKVMANGAKKMNSQVGKSLYSGDVGQFYQDVYTYFNNYSKGLPGATGLTPAKRDFIRKSIGLGDPNTSSQSGRTPNPYSWSVSALKDAKDTALNSYRLDRTNWIDLGNPRMKKELDRPLTSRESGQGGSYQRIRENYYPGVDDARYMELAKNPEGNREELQGLVDAAAKRAGFTEGPLFHGSHSAGITEFEPGRAGYIYFTPQKEYANDYGSNITEAFLKFDNLADLTDPNSEAYKKAVEVFNRNGGWGLNPDAMEGRSSPDFNPKTDYTWELFDNPDTDIQAEMREYDAWKLQERDGIISYAIADPSQIKSADPVTYDDNGNVIPLSERFDQRSDDIRFHPGVDTPTPDGGIVRKFSDGTEITQGMHYFPGTVYHGTGHTVDEFSTRRIGDGEGVQAFGWGLYFTQNINIGKDYANRLSIRQRTWKGEEIPGTIYRGDPTPAVNNLVDDATQFILENFPWYKDGDNLHPLINSSLFSPIEIYGSNEWEKLVNKAKSEFQQYKNDLEKWKAGEIKKRPYQDLVDEVTLLTDHLSANYRVERKASLYEVKIHPEEETFLNWDKTFSEQSQFVQDTLTELAGDDLNQIRYLNGDPKNSELTGMGIYSQLKQQAKQTAGPFTALRDLGVSKSAMETSIKLEEYGIKGVMYLDGVSRKKGEGNHNLVVFNDRDIEIISRDERSGTNVRFHPGVDDARYMELVKDPNSDKTELRTLVEAAAKQAGYDTSRIVYRGDEMPFNELMAGEESGNLGRGLYFTPDRSYARRYGNPREFYLRGKIADIQSPEILPRYESILKELEEFGEDPDLVFSELAEELGVDGFSAKGVGGFSFGAEEIVVPEGSFAKSAALEVRDDSGNIIPLSERFNLQSDDIRYSPGVGERIPELEEAAKKLQSGSLSKEEYSNLVDKYKPVHPYTSVPQPATMEEMRGALASNKLPRLGKGSEISEGQEVGLRLDIPAYTQKGVWIPTIHHKKGNPIAHESVAMVTDATFPDSGEKGMRVAIGGNKAPFAVINGKWKPITPDQASSMAESAMSDSTWTQVGFDPTRHSYFYDRKNHRSQVISADEVIQIGPLVLAKNAQTKTLSNQSSDIRFSPGSSQNTVDGNYQRLVESINAYTNPNLSRGINKGRKDSLGDELRAQAKGRTSEVQRNYLKQAAKRSGLSIPYQDLVQRVNRSGLEAYLKSPSGRAGDITRLRQLLGINDVSNLDSSTFFDALLNAANPDGDLVFLGSGMESLAFRDNSDGKVLKLRQTKTGDTHKFGLDVDVGSNGQVRIIMGDDFGAVQAVHEFSGAFDTRYELEGFTDGMEYMLLKQDFIKPARDTKTSDVANYMLDNGWVIKVAPTTENIGGHQDVNQYFWFNRDKQLVAADAHVGNFHVDQNGNTVPIDLPTRKLTTQETAKVDMYYHPGVDEDGIVSQENMPGYNSGILRGLHSAKPSDKMAFHKAIQKALHYKKGDQLVNIIAEEMGVDASEMATGISAYLNSKAFLEMNPATQVTGFPSLEMAELYALLHGYFTYQEAVSGYKPEYGLKAGGDWGDPSILTDFILRDKNGNPVKATAAQVKKIHKIIEANTSHMPPGEFGDPQAGDVAYFLTDKGFRLMFLDLPINPDMNSQIFANIISDVTESLKINENDIENTTTNSIYQENKWGSATDGGGEAYRAEIADKGRKAGQPDLLGRLERRLGPILQPVYDKFAKKGLGNPGTQPGVVREVAGVTLPRTMSQLSDADALTIANKVAPVKRGEDPYSAIEAREIVEDYMAWDKLSATEGDQFMGELKRVAKVNQKQLMDAKRKGKESVGQLKEKQVPAKAEMEGIPRKNQSVVFKNNDKVHFGIPKVSDVKYTIKWDKNKGKDGAFVVGASHMAKSDVFPNIVLDGELGKAIEKPDHHASVFEATKKLNELVSGDPEKATSKQGYLEFMKKVGASSNALVVPSTLEVALTNPKLMADMILGDRLHGKRKIETRQNALDGLDGTLEFREAIGEGQAPDNRVTALLHLWGILSRMLPPLDQEGLWLRMMANRDVLEAVHKSTEGKFNLSEAKWKKIVAESRDMTDKNAAKIGNNATSNANSFHAALKLLNGRWDELGRSFATNDHSQMRQQYWDVVAKRGSLGIKNKVLSFMGLTTGIPTWVGDRWQYVFANLPTLERMTGKESSSMFTYDRYNTPEDPTGIYSIYGTLESDNPVFSNLLYEYINTSLQNAFEANPKEYKEMLGDHVNASGFHWVTWNAIKNEPVGHSSLSILLKLQKESGNIKTLDDFINLVMNEKTYTEGRKSGKNFRLIFDKGTITHDSTIVKD